MSDVPSVSPSAARTPNLRLVCPGCGAAGTVAWERLGHELKCPACASRFVLDEHGELVLSSRLPRRSFSCPRCAAKGEAPIFAGAEPRCPSCQLRLVEGADGELRGAQESRTRMRPTLSAPRRPPRAATSNAKFLEWWQGVDRIRRLAALMFMGALVAGVVYFRVGGGRIDDVPPVEKLVRRCLSGDADGAESLLAEDAVQKPEFKRWCTRHFASVMDRFRPDGDAVSIETLAADENSARPPREDGACDSTTLDVTLRSTFLGARKHRQVWVRVHDQWRFDAAATLRAEDFPQGAGSNQRGAGEPP